MKILITAILFGLITPHLASQKTTGPDDLVFICPPCGMPCDTAVHTTAGICQHCGMGLVAGYKEMLGQNSRGHFQHIRGKSLAILLFPGVEIIDFAPQYEIFGQAGMRVFTVAKNDSVIETGFGMRVIPDFTFADAPSADIVLLPGGHVDDTDEQVLAWIKQAVATSEMTLSVCNGAFFLARAGLLDGLEATTFNGSINHLQEIAPATKVVRNKRFVDNGKIVTSAGLASGIDAAFHMLGKYEGPGRAQEVATFLEYNWDKEGRYVRAMLADRHVRQLDEILRPFIVNTTIYEGDQNHWTLEVIVTDELISIEKIMALLRHQWSISEGWVMTKESKTSSHWKLTDAESTTWRGHLIYTPDDTNFSIRVSVKKSN